MKRLAIFLMTITAILSSGFTSKKGTWIIDSSSRLTIYGTTNINNFACKMEYYNGSDTLQYVKNYTDGELQFSRNKMTVPIRNFDCGAKEISKDFQKSLKSETYPQLTIHFLTLQDVSVKNNCMAIGIVDIALAGVTCRYTIKFSVIPGEKNIILLKGIHPVNFSDFKLIAPKKLNGLIKVAEVLNVDFSLVLKEVK